MRVVEWLLLSVLGVTVTLATLMIVMPLTGMFWSSHYVWAILGLAAVGFPAGYQLVGR